MVKRILSNGMVQTFVRLTTALSFALFTAYQIYLAVQMASNKTGRRAVIVLYLTITAASFLAFSYSRRLQRFRSGLMLVCLALLFFVRLINVPYLLHNLQSSDIPSALNCIVYVLTQLGTILLTIMWLKRRRPFVTYKAIAPLIPVVIVIYAGCFAVECVLMLHYRINAESSLTLALLGRLVYFIGFSGTAFTFFFSNPRRQMLDPLPEA